MPVYKSKEITKDKKQWYFQVSYKDINGIQKKYKSKKYATKKDAEEDEMKFKLKEKTITSSSITFLELYYDYLNHLKPRIKYSSYYSWESIGRLYLLPYFAKKKVNDLTMNDIRKWQQVMIDKGFAENYLRKMHTFLGSILTFGIKFHGIIKNVATMNGNFKLQSKEKKEMTFWTLEEFNQFISVVDHLVYNLLFNLLYYTGMRKGEARALTWNDYDKNIIRINKTLSHHGESTSAKTYSSTREIMIHDKLSSQLNEMMESQKKYKNFSKKWFIFGGIESLPLTTMCRYFKNYIKKSGVKEINIHSLRHSHASFLINNGATILLVSQRLGHSDTKMTLNTYSHLYPNAQEEIVKMLNKLQ